MHVTNKPQPIIKFRDLTIIIGKTTSEIKVDVVLPFRGAWLLYLINLSNETEELVEYRGNRYPGGQPSKETFPRALGHEAQLPLTQSNRPYFQWPLLFAGMN